jgi:site-specific recombinase
VKVRRDKEYYFGSKVPYSYVKDEQNHHPLLVDDRLRNIIEKYHSGESILSIFKDFNHIGVVTPAIHIGLKR